jgi:prefoldin subunit 5
MSFLKWAIERNRGDALEKLREEVAVLRTELVSVKEELEELKRGGTYVNEDGEKVPMSQVLNEYLYGAKEGDA